MTTDKTTEKASARPENDAQDHSHWEIERWEAIIQKDADSGMTRLRAYICGLIGGKMVNEDFEVFMARKGLTRFLHWYRHQVGL